MDDSDNVRPGDLLWVPFGCRIYPDHDERRPFNKVEGSSLVLLVARCPGRWKTRGAFTSEMLLVIAPNGTLGFIPAHAVERA